MGNSLPLSDELSSIVEYGRNPLDTHEEFERLNGTVLDRDVPLSRSKLWAAQLRFYEQLGIEAWSRSVVPYLVTSNAFVARSVARVLVEHLSDVTSQPCRAASGAHDTFDTPLVLEIGAGHGKLAPMVLRKLALFSEALEAVSASLAELRGQAPTELPRPFLYVMTDSSEATVAYWRKQPIYRPFVEAGLLDFAVVNVLETTELHLLESGVRISASGIAPRFPTLAIGAYVLSSLPMDVARVEVGGQLRFGLATVASTHVEPDDTHPELLHRAHIKWRFAPLTAGEQAPAAAATAAAAVEQPTQEAAAGSVALDAVLSDGALQRALLETASDTALRAGGGAVNVPTGGVAMLQNLKGVLGNQFLVLVLDRGNTASADTCDTAVTPSDVTKQALRAGPTGGQVAGSAAGDGGDEEEKAGEGAEGDDEEQDGDGGDVLAQAKRLRELRQERERERSAASHLSLQGRPVAQPGVLTPHGAVSASVDFPLLGRAVRHMGGWLETGQRREGLKVALIGVGLTPEEALSPRRAVQAAMQRLGPHDFGVVQRGVVQSVPALGRLRPRPQSGVTPPPPPPPQAVLNAVLPLARIGGCDSEVVFKYQPGMLHALSVLRGSLDANHGLRSEVASTLVATAGVAHSLSAVRDTSFDIGRIAMLSRNHRLALQLFMQSNVEVGEHFASWHNIGECYYNLGDLPGAVAALERSLELKADFQQSREWLERIKAEREGRQPPPSAAAAAPTPAPAAAAAADAEAAGPEPDWPAGEAPPADGSVLGWLGSFVG